MQIVQSGYTNSIGVRLVRVDPGSFLMGNDDPETARKVEGPEHLPEGDWDERPIHKVTISRPFYMSVTETTDDQYRQFDADWQGGGPFSPFVSGISWYDAAAFCEWLSEKEGKSYRLPTEAEWEYACRAETRTLFASGDAPPDEGWTNPWGLQNMHTGPAEWCLDWHGMYPDDDQLDPVGIEKGVARVVRGGGLHDLQSVHSPYLGTHPYYRRSANRAGAPPSYKGRHTAGFRIVEATMPESKPSAYEAPFVQQCVRQNTSYVEQGPDPNVPHFRRRHALSIPPENVPNDASRAAGLHPAMLYHNHSPGLAACPNGDLLAVYFTASTPSTENWPNVALIATRLRYGSDQWDMPELLIDLPDMNDGPAMLWNDDGTLHLFFGALGMQGAIFRWCSSTDNGAAWDEVKVVFPVGEVGGYTAQPINSAFRGPDGTMYISSDAAKHDSLLWASRDDGETWFDTGGRTLGRHTTFVLLKDESILGMGGKHCSIDGYMTRSISHDWGKTWEVHKTPFPALGGNQRPTIVRLASGRLFFAGDFQHLKGYQPEGVTEKGAYVALSEDEGETWRIKKLPGTLPHEAATIVDPPGTLGYAVACQSPNDIIHLISTMNHPSLHFEMNEAWILQDGDTSTDSETANTETAVCEVERYPSGQMRTIQNATIRKRRYLLDGVQAWFYEDGRKQWEVVYQNGRKVDLETYWSQQGHKLWSWDHQGNGTSVWTQWWPDGRQKSESFWRDGKCVGAATHRDRSGNVILQEEFVDGKMLDTCPE